MKTINVVMSSAVALVGLFYLTSGQAGCGSMSEQINTCSQIYNSTDCQNNSCCTWKADTSGYSCYPKS